MSTLLCYGMPGTGKTQALADLTAAHSDVQLFFVCDRTGDWGLESSNRRWRNRPPKGLMLGANEHAEYINGIYNGDYSAATVEKVETYIEETEGTGVLVFQTPWQEWEVAEYAKAVGNSIFVSDEIDTVATYKDWDINPLKDIVHRGRHLPNRDGIIGEMGIFGACRRPSSLHTDITSLADTIFVFRVAGKRTTDRLVADSLIESANDTEVNELPNFHYILWRSTEKNKSRGFVVNPWA